MVRLTRLYTRTGDDGTTALVTGARVEKHHPRLAAVGSVDELNAVLGVAWCHVAAEETTLLATVQNDLFDLGADLATPLDPDESPGHALRMQAPQVSRLEAWIDRYNEALPPLDSFILPAGSLAAAHLHHARTVARRAERDVTALAVVAPVTPAARQYLNRLSDLLFVLARHVLPRGEEVCWAPGGGGDE